MVVLGAVGLFLPVLQGLLFVMIGLTVLAHDVPWARRVLDRVRASRFAETVRRWMAGRRHRTGVGPRP